MALATIWWHQGGCFAPKTYQFYRFNFYATLLNDHFNKPKLTLGPGLQYMWAFCITMLANCIICSSFYKGFVPLFCTSEYRQKCILQEIYRLKTSRNSIYIMCLHPYYNNLAIQNDRKSFTYKTYRRKIERVALAAIWWHQGGCFSPKT